MNKKSTRILRKQLSRMTNKNLSRNLNKKPTRRFVKKAGKWRTTITLSPKNIRKTQDLGNGFFIIEFEQVSIAPNSVQEIILANIGIRRVVSAGWTMTDNLPVSVLENFPFSQNQWILTFLNQTSVRRAVSTFLVTKLP
ncbi:hypothetical protein [Brevibacillus formosus]|uniref:hypothetical protein n=1 Tax=Brevibacillus formosus TaxID=54913 RepID=UPI000B5A2548|nr:hypothetical protein [Brevibacillus formosus]